MTNSEAQVYQHENCQLVEQIVLKGMHSLMITKFLADD